MYLQIEIMSACKSDESILKVVVSGDPMTDQRGEESSIRALACTNVFWLVTVVGLGLQFAVSQVIQSRSQDLVIHRVLFSPVHLQCRPAVEVSDTGPAGDSSRR